MLASQSACGSANVVFDVKVDTAQHPSPEAETDKALVYIIEDLGQCPDCYAQASLLNVVSDVSGAVIKFGADGSWVRASKGDSYFFLTMAPGEHHICANWQSSLEERSRAYAFTDLTAEP